MATQTITDTGLVPSGQFLIGFSCARDIPNQSEANGFYKTSVVIYRMQAFDSITGDEYQWTIRQTPDWNGSNYPGPNSPTDIAIVIRAVF